MLTDDEFPQLLSALFIFLPFSMSYLRARVRLFHRERLLYFHQRLADLLSEVLPNDVRQFLSVARGGRCHQRNLHKAGVFGGGFSSTGRFSCNVSFHLKGCTAPFELFTEGPKAICNKFLAAKNF